MSDFSPAFLIAAGAVALAGCNVSYSSTASQPSLTVRGPADQVSAFVETQTQCHPDLVMTRGSGGSGQSRVTLALPDTVSGDELTAMSQQAIRARLSVEIKS